MALFSHFAEVRVSSARERYKAGYAVILEWRPLNSYVIAHRVHVI
jgi:hypothetical protein